MAVQAARRRFERTPGGQPKPATYGPWHVRDDRSGFTWCGQGMRDHTPFDTASADTAPAGALCQRCWDRWSGSRRPGEFHPGLVDARHVNRPTPSTPRKRP